MTPRLFVEHRLATAQRITLSAAQTHYLTRVMRLKTGSDVILFNGRDGEWACRIDQLKPSAELTCTQLRRAQLQPPDVWLLFTPLKRPRTEFAVEKATELGVARILPILTERCERHSVNLTRLRAIATEAAEQCGALSVPEIRDTLPLLSVLVDWPAGRRLYFCDEEFSAVPDAPRISGGGVSRAVLIGPEGGFTEGERTRLAAMPFISHVGLGKRILRAETAVAAALALMNMGCG
ncbi:MAG: 16S rRNA (uracil(1498)-N(3))-methyltransferase [Rhodobacteraceae bacterium]|nr:16S rRNA (uracil(1498)-N(3))-methyltransferase [Paracoccaceae bacterium]